jgi:hypothetical protein
LKLSSIFGLAIATALVVVGTTPTWGAMPLPTKKYSNCAALNHDYPGGVAKSSGTRNKGGVTKYIPRVSAKVYSENKSKDRDKDGIVCER